MDRLPATKRARILALLCDGGVDQPRREADRDVGRTRPAASGARGPVVRLLQAGERRDGRGRPGRRGYSRGRPGGCPGQARPLPDPAAELPNRPVTLTPGGTGGRPGWWSRGRAVRPA